MRFYFDVRDGAPIRDHIGMEFTQTSQAVAYARHLAADLRARNKFVRPDCRICVVAANGTTVHEEPVAKITPADLRKCDTFTQGKAS